MHNNISGFDSLIRNDNFYQLFDGRQNLVNNVKLIIFVVPNLICIIL